MVSVINDNNASVSLIEFYDGGDEKIEQHDIVAGIYFEAVVTSRKNFFYECIIDFVNILEINNHKYQINVKVRY